MGAAIVEAGADLFDRRMRRKARGGARGDEALRLALKVGRCAAAETRAERAMCCCAAEGGAVGTRTITVPLAAW